VNPDRPPADGPDRDEQDGVTIGRRHRRISPLTLRILAVNVLALVFLAGAVLYLDQFRAALIQSHVDAMVTEGQIIAGALGEAATVGPEATDLQLVPARQIVQRLVGETGRRTRLFSADGRLLLDSRHLAVDQSIKVAPLPPLNGMAGLQEQAVRALTRFLDAVEQRADLPAYKEYMVQKADHYPEIVAALGGEVAHQLWQGRENRRIITVAVPVQRLRRVLGALLLSADTREIDMAVHEARFTILKLFAVTLILTLMLSIFLGNTIVRPIRMLARAADRVRLNVGQKAAIPDFSERGDEIGDLSLSLRDMTDTLERQLDGVAAFAADVSHELKNPLTSLRSAAETLNIVKDQAARDKLTNVIMQDVTRLDRLITDISRASRVDAEMSHARMEPVNITRVLEMLYDTYLATGLKNNIGLELQLVTDPVDQKPEDVIVNGLEGALGQVFRNLIDNALSFSPTGKTVAIRLRIEKQEAEIAVEDEGVGIPEDKLSHIFGRFYSERPAGEAFGHHSGLGLSICKQIVKAHHGHIYAENRIGRTGARFVVKLPLATTLLAPKAAPIG
tara:strand:- start:3332 stop:5020 length:1689 start_codon:yes stop_codon:yes gene_type:complete